MLHKLLTVLILTTLSFFFYFNTSLRDQGARLFHLDRLEPANSTLGFGAVIAVSKAGSARREGLLFAANITGIDIDIPNQPAWTEDDVEAFRSPQGSKIDRGSALAWMAHLNALRWFQSTNLSTALILEDDVDWSIHLRLSQIPLAARALRSLTSPDSITSIPEPSENSPNAPQPPSLPTSSPTYWGDLTQWELLHIGHCGDFFPAKRLPTLPHTIYEDATVLPWGKLHHKTAEFLANMGLRQQERIVHKSRWPLCTFGYAVTQASAARLLAEHGTEGGPKGERGCVAFDVRTLEACRDKGWKCFSASPELFHHITAPSMIKNVNEGVDDSGRLAGGKGPEDVQGTMNIYCGARSRDFFSRDNATVEYLREVVGEKGVCLVDGMGDGEGRWP
ncbi:glycosyltransferase family 25 protein [Patellaria atrata CBS 101060]|uniref:Glycosyltransferase family 25 protein n=1 Tax=Patellaria atrata CBS 101060 TaxID=1346257 RepID=A0A9P4VRQ5_9PEZI|nr:glycosyltransferase family 25 protein [Patellaria atrata CBS 101060]